MNKVHYNVSNLLNAEMKTQVKNVLSEIDGVQKVNIDLAESTIDVNYNNGTNENEIIDGIEHVGCKIKWF